MSTTTILFVSLLFLFVAGENVHDITSAGACHLSAFVRVGDLVHWRNPTNQTLYIRGDDCHTKLDIVIPPEQSAMYVFQIRGICQYHSSACPSEVGVLNVKARIRRRSIAPSGSKNKACTALCKGTVIKSVDVSSAKLCGHSFDYVMRGVVSRYYIPNGGNLSIELVVKHNYLHPVCQVNCLQKNPYKESFLWMLHSQSSKYCACPMWKIGREILVMGYRYNTKLAIDLRSKIATWDSKMSTRLTAFQKKFSRKFSCAG